MSYRDDAWFAGFTDGEASFAITGSRKEGVFAPRFQLTLRADDAAILESLREEFGGRTYYYGIEQASGLQSPLCHWRISSKHELLGLVGYFDQFPLRAKKARDYAIWRQAVLIYQHSTRSDSRLKILSAALKDARALVVGELPTVVRESPLFDVQEALDIP